MPLCVLLGVCADVVVGKGGEMKIKSKALQSEKFESDSRVGSHFCWESGRQYTIESICTIIIISNITGTSFND